MDVKENLVNNRRESSKDYRKYKSWAKTFMLFLNILLFVGSISIVAWCGYIFKNRKQYTIMLSSSTVFLAYYILTAVGILLFIVTILGFVALFKNLTKWLTIYNIGLVILIFAELAAIAIALYYGNFYFKNFETDMNDKMLRLYKPGNTEFVESVDYLQTELKCCGASTFRNWETSEYVKSQVSSDKELVPQSCCKSRMIGCGKSTHPSNIYHKGCGVRLYDQIKENISIIQFIGISAVGAQIICILLGTCLLRILQKDYEMRKNFHAPTRIN